VTGPVIAVGAAFIGMAAVVAFPVLHTAFQRAPSTLVALIVGGVILGILGSIGGPLTLFKGLDEMKRLTADAASYSAVSLAGLGVIKLVAMLVAGTAGFRGGRIFPAVFVGVALGLSVHAAWPEIPQALAVASTLVGILVAVTRSGWLSLFMAALMVGGTDMLPILCVVILPAWLVVTGRPEMIVKRPPMPGPAGA
jgi:H+/Cl- antiporter ClcA